MAADYGFPRTFRLKKRSDYLKMNSQAQGKMFFAGYMVVVRLNGQSDSRLGVTVTRKIGSAVVRNKLKRRAREFFRINHASWPKGLDILFIASKNWADHWPPKPGEVIGLGNFFQKMGQSCGKSLA